MEAGIVVSCADPLKMALNVFETAGSMRRREMTWTREGILSSTSSASVLLRFDVGSSVEASLVSVGLLATARTERHREARKVLLRRRGGVWTAAHLLSGVEERSISRRLMRAADDLSRALACRIRASSFSNK